MKSTKRILMVVLAGFACLTGAGAKSIAKKDYNFIDKSVVEHTIMLERMPSPVNKPGSHLIANASSVGGVIKGKDGLLRMWYRSKKAFKYLESKDPLKWNVAKAKNLRGVDLAKSSYICVSLTAKTPFARGRYTLFARELPQKFAYSDDGINWTAYKKGEAVAEESDCLNNFFYDRNIGKYVLYCRPHPGITAGNDPAYGVARIESKDLRHWDWETARCVFDTDLRDAPAISKSFTGAMKKAAKDIGVAEKSSRDRGRNIEVTQMTVSCCENLYLGFAGFLNKQKNICATYILHSYDGKTWKREPYDRPFVALSKGKWDSAIAADVAPGCPVTIDGKMYFYYTGMDSKGSKNIGVGCAKSGRFVGYYAEDMPCEMMTRPFVLTGKNLTINASIPKGRITVEILHANGKNAKGFAKDKFIVLAGKDGTRLPLKWQGKADLSELTGKKIRLRIGVYEGVIYAFNIK